MKINTNEKVLTINTLKIDTVKVIEIDEGILIPIIQDGNNEFTIIELAGIIAHEVGERMLDYPIYNTYIEVNQFEHSIKLLVEIISDEDIDDMYDGYFDVELSNKEIQLIWDLMTNLNSVKKIA